MPTEAEAAKLAPWSSARKKAMGPEVNGMPTSHPPTAAPQRRPARLAAPIRVGVTTSFRIRLSTPRIVAALYSPKCLVDDFCELRIDGVLRSSLTNRFRIGLP